MNFPADRDANGIDMHMNSISSSEIQSATALSPRKSSSDSATELEVGGKPEHWKEQSQESFLASFASKKPSSEESIKARSSGSGEQTDAGSESSLSSQSDDGEVTEEHIRQIRSIREKLLDDMEKMKLYPLKDLPSDERHMLTGVEYLDRTLGQVLAQGLGEIIKRKPANPVEFLAAYLLADQARIDNLQSDISHVSRDNDTDDND
ncbi:uncharacterized protein LOC129585961 [Paramacrobiotus metropolitanus]|uniref:uncharacterized protein LOC129585961 n=1 Tax=Paramacrobiotus metropolitanus TaxID=2943436 RepID=UPI00244595A2|nr:uncharacterized protein LOC129585961 [Paramacrobiotus metropolitanus]